MLLESQKRYLRECVRLHFLHIEISEDLKWIIDYCKMLFIGMSIAFAVSLMIFPCVLCLILALILVIASLVFDYKNKNTREKCLSDFEKELEDVNNE